MALRLLELSVPGEAVERIPKVLANAPVLHLWASELADGLSLVRILVDAAQVETVTDRLVTYFSPMEGFRLITLEVVETIPAVDADAHDQKKREQKRAKAQPQRISREELYQDVSQASRVTPVYGVMVALSTVVAAVGLVRGDVAIIIGAMVIAPLLGPNVALSLACTLGDPALFRQSLKAMGAGFVIAAALSVVLGFALQVDPGAPGIAARTQAGFGDVILALAAGGAGTLAFTSGVPGVVVGVMVSVALLPPLVTAGLLAGGGHDAAASGALVLLLTNVTCINLAATATFFIQKVRPRTWWEADRAGRATRRAVATWIIMLGILLVLMLFGHVGAM